MANTLGIPENVLKHWRDVASPQVYEVLERLYLNHFAGEWGKYAFAKMQAKEIIHDYVNDVDSVPAMSLITHGITCGLCMLDGPDYKIRVNISVLGNLVYEDDVDEITRAYTSLEIGLIIARSPAVS